eukprot:TRINITY_DN2776_c0_g1_i6.p1 TRINITY_DN2776_c0_g1~~TRINITY_DN2776_c0_g1_i6.p1  ORF type:complete len:371 (+),score=34.67 TRINITY_DN2776_c0_g1_i6:68-1180(+)
MGAARRSGRRLSNGAPAAAAAGGGSRSGCRTLFAATAVATVGGGCALLWAAHLHPSGMHTRQEPSADASPPQQRQQQQQQPATESSGSADGGDPVRVHGYEVMAEHPHDTRAFTQGLVWDAVAGTLYESTGMYGDSDVREVHLSTGRVLRRTPCEKRDFGEGLTIVHRQGGTELLQLLWTTSKGYRYGLPSMTRSSTVHTSLNDAWGLTEAAAGTLLATDGGSILYRLNPETLRVQKKIRVKDGKRWVPMLNELEWLEDDPATPGGEPDPVLYANVFGRDCIARIDPDTGSVRGWIVLHTLAQDKGLFDRDSNRVLNGIAWHPRNATFLVTGKYWPSLYEVRLVPEQRGNSTPRKVRELCMPPRNVFGKL